MSKKIEFFNKNNINFNTKTTNIKEMGRNSGSKVSKSVKKPRNTKTVQNSKTATIPKKRGRRPKKILESPLQEENQEEESVEKTSAVILRLNIDPSKLKNIKAKNKNKFYPNIESRSGSESEPESESEINDDNEDDDDENYPSKSKLKTTSQTKNKKSILATKKKLINSESDDDSGSSEEMFRNDIPGDNICHKCVINEKKMTLMKSKLDKYDKKDNVDKSNKIYYNKLNFLSFSTGKKMKIEKTNLKCWWDTYTFDSLPCFLPELYHDKTYHVTGCFCSFDCALAYNLYYKKDSKIDHRKSLVYKLYRELYDLSVDDIIEIKEAPPKELLEDYGGELSIKSYRRKFNTMNKEYIIFIPPIKPINILIEEHNIDPIDDSDKDLVIKRHKPLSKKRSVMASMKTGAKK